jgi:hypothetical protein
MGELRCLGPATPHLGKPTMLHSQPSDVFTTSGVAHPAATGCTCAAKPTMLHSH